MVCVVGDSVYSTSVAGRDLHNVYYANLGQRACINKCYIIIQIKCFNLHTFYRPLAACGMCMRHETRYRRARALTGTTGLLIGSFASIYMCIYMYNILCLAHAYTTHVSRRLLYHKMPAYACTGTLANPLCNTHVSLYTGPWHVLYPQHDHPIIFSNI